MDPLAVGQPPHILARGNNRTAPGADLARSVCLIVFRVEIVHLPALPVVLADLTLRGVLPVWRPHAARPIPHPRGLLPQAIFLAVLRGWHGHCAALPGLDPY